MDMVKAQRSKFAYILGNKPRIHQLDNDPWGKITGPRAFP
jgi:hypothetical protein